jgi:hypothetical protein
MSMRISLSFKRAFRKIESILALLMLGRDAGVYYVYQVGAFLLERSLARLNLPPTHSTFNIIPQLVRLNSISSHEINYM